MNVLTFVLVKRLRALIGLDKSAWQITLRIGWLVLVVLYGIGLGMTLQLIFSKTDKKVNFTIEELVLYINLTVGAIYLISNFFPTYIKASKPIARPYPIAPLIKWLISVLYDITTILFTSVALVYFALWISNALFTTAFLVASIASLMTIFFFLRSVKIIIEYKVTYKALWISALILISLAIYHYYTKFDTVYKSEQLLVNVITALILAVMNFTITNQAIETTSRNLVVLYPNSLKGPYFYFLRKSSSRTVFLIGILVKFIFLLSILSRLRNSTDNHELNFIISVVYISPVLIYSYLYNNAWGYYPQLWINLSSRKSSIKEQIKWYMKLITVPLSIDFIITVIFLSINQYMTIDYVLFYITAATLLTLAGIWFSFNTPIYITSIISFNEKGNVNFLSVISSLLILGISALPLFFNWAYFINFGIIIIVAFFTIKQFRNNQKIGYLMYNKIIRRTD